MSWNVHRTTTLVLEHLGVVKDVNAMQGNNEVTVTPVNSVLLHKYPH